jgi:hypothetical protein
MAAKSEMHEYRHTTYGRVRGGCHRLYETREAAERSCRRDAAGCESQGGYSDRKVCEVDEDGILYHDLAADDWVYGPGGRSCGAMAIDLDTAIRIK